MIGFGGEGERAVRPELAAGWRVRASLAGRPNASADDFVPAKSLRVACVPGAFISPQLLPAPSPPCPP